MGGDGKRRTPHLPRRGRSWMAPNQRMRRRRRRRLRDLAGEETVRGRRMAIRRIAAVAALLICLAVAAEAHAAAPREFYGLISAQDPTPAQIDRMGAGKVGTLRINLV